MPLLAASLMGGSLAFPEGPLVLGPDKVAFVEEYSGSITVCDNGCLSTLAAVGGCPNGLALGPDQRIYFTQNTGGGGWYRCREPRTPGIYALDVPGGLTELVTAEASGKPLRQPNDLCFDPDGVLYFTDPGAEPAYEPGWICRHFKGTTEIVLDTGPTFPNGIGFDAEGRLLWTETRTQRIMTLGVGPVLVAQLDKSARPDGFAVCADGTLVVATLFSGGIDVVAPGPDGRRRVTRETWTSGIVATNCAFQGHELWVTDASSHPDEVDTPTGRLWRVTTDLSGLPLPNTPRTRG